MSKQTHNMALSSQSSNFFSPPQGSDIERCVLAIKNNRLSMLSSLATKQLINKSDPHNKSLLHHAVYFNSLDSVLFLMLKGADALQMDEDGQNVFHICAYKGHIEIVKLIRFQQKCKHIRQLLKKYLLILEQFGYKRTDMKQGKLKYSVSEGKLKLFQKMQKQASTIYEQYVFQLLKQYKNSITGTLKSTNRNSFHLGCLNKYQKCSITLQLLLQQIQNSYIKVDNKTLQIYNQVNQYLKPQQKIDPRLFEQTLQMLQQCIVPTRLAQIRKQLKNKIQQTLQLLFQAKDKNNQTPLHIASKVGSTSIINLIRKWQSTKTKKTQDKQDLIKIANHSLARSHIMDLCDASRQADSNTMNFLLNCGQSINKKKTIFGTFPLLEAVKSYQKQHKIDHVRLLVLSGADLNEQDTNGWSIFHHAAEKGMLELLKQIFNLWNEGKTMKPLLNKLTNKNYHILHLAGMNNQTNVVQYLLTDIVVKKLQINPNALDGQKCNMLHHAAKKGSMQTLKKVLDLSPQIIYSQDVGGNTGLHYAATYNHENCIKYLLYFDSDQDKLSGFRNTKGKLAKDLTMHKKSFQNVYSAARQGDVNLVRKLILQNKNLRQSCTYQKKRSLLMLAVINKHLLVVKLLVQIGADLDQKDTLGKSALDYAKDLQASCKTKQEIVIAKNILAILTK